MKEKHFIWIAETSWPRKGAKLIRGDKYKSKDYPEHVVEEWVRTGAARWVKPTEQEEAEESIKPARKG